MKYSPSFRWSTAACVWIAAACASAPTGQDAVLAEDVWLRCQGHESWGHFDDHAGIREGDGSHGAFIETRINPKAAEDQAGLPFGSVLLKANYSSEDPSSLESFVAMARVPGYDPRHQDWFYATYSPSGKVLQAGASDACVNCHRAAGDGDYVFYNDRY